jgi:hypothetical protein
MRLAPKRKGLHTSGRKQLPTSLKGHP